MQARGAILHQASVVQVVPTIDLHAGMGDRTLCFPNLLLKQGPELRPFLFRSGSMQLILDPADRKGQCKHTGHTCSALIRNCVVNQVNNAALAVSVVKQYELHPCF